MERPLVVSEGNIEAMQELCEMLEETFPHRVFTVELIYRDYGQNWKWNTIVSRNKTTGDHYQVLNPREWEMLKTGEFSAIAEAFNRIIEKQDGLLRK